MRPSNADLRSTDAAPAPPSRVFREVNDRIRELAEPLRSDRARDFICECDDPACLEIVRLTLAEYDVIRRSRRGPVLARHHRRLRAADGWRATAG